MTSLRGTNFLKTKSTTRLREAMKGQKMATPADYLKLPYGRVVVPEEDGSFRAEIVEFPGCIATADSSSEALQRLEGVAESWLQSVIDRGQNVPEPMDATGFSGKFVVRLPKSLHRRATYAAARDGTSLNQFIVNCVAEHVGAIGCPRTVYVTSPVTCLSIQHIPGGAMTASVGFAHHQSTQKASSLMTSPIIFPDFEHA